MSGNGCFPVAAYCHAARDYELSVESVCSGREIDNTTRRIQIVMIAGGVVAIASCDVEQVLNGLCTVILAGVVNTEVKYVE